MRRLTHGQEVNGPIATALCLRGVTEIFLNVLHVLQVCPGDTIKHLPLVGQAEVNTAALIVELAAVSDEVQTDIVAVVALIGRFTKRIFLCGGGSSRQLVDVPVDEGQLLDDVLSQSFLQKQAAAMLLDGVLPVTLKSEHAVALNKVLTQVNFGAVLLEGAAAVRTGAFVIVLTHLDVDRNFPQSPGNFYTFYFLFLVFFL